MEGIRARAAGIEPWIIDARRELHQIPELLYEEHETSAVLRKHLDALKIPYKCAVATAFIDLGARTRSMRTSWSTLCLVPQIHRFSVTAVVTLYMSHSGRSHTGAALPKY